MKWQPETESAACTFTRRSRISCILMQSSLSFRFWFVMLLHKHSNQADEEPFLGIRGFTPCKWKERLRLSAISDGAFPLAAVPVLVVAWKQPSKPINRRNVGEVSLSACLYAEKNSTEHHHPTEAVFGLNSGKIREDQSVFKRHCDPRD